MSGHGEKRREPTWYKDAIVYELRVRSFYDTNADGVGDLAGATEKLDYLADLGVTAVWLLPFYPSPGRDDGYDISDYTDVHAEIGTLADFERFLAEAHRRNIRVITELVLNHTSDQHPWFQGARRAPPGSPERAFYVFSDTAEEYKSARVIFQDFEPSNWTWDPMAKAYYWHRFYAHQPDLNFDNPAVENALLEIVDFWFSLGVDGVRLDAVPYLYEREGTSCENLPETHGFLKRLRAHIDERFEDKMILAEANQWPEDAAAYFGDGNECHMNFHFPLMPRMFMSLHMEDRLPLVDIFAQTPALPSSCQWALFLRNHDELTLEMVTDEERDTMLKAYARETRMRVNLGIRRRLAPLVANDRRRMELLNGLLFSLPGTPVVYYGDEIGMGDNVYLGDRDGVRTPMQWSSDRNAGFSRAKPQKLVLPIVMDPEYHHEALNVEAQQNNGSSLLWWMKRLIALRKRWPAFGRGTIEFLTPENHKVLAFVRRWEGQAVLVVANLSRDVQFAELDLAAFRGAVPVELFGRTELPVVGERPYFLTLSPHGFYWLSLERGDEGRAERADARKIPVLEVDDGLASLVEGPGRAHLEAALPSYFTALDASGRVVESSTIEEVFPLSGSEVALVVATLTRSEGDPELVALALTVAESERAAEIRSRAASAVVALLRSRDPHREEGSAVLFDALADAPSAAAFVTTILRGSRIRGRARDLVTRATGPLDSLLAEPDLGGAPSLPASETRLLPSENRGGTLVFRERVLLKPYRSLEAGPSARHEMGRFLTERPALGSFPSVGASLELVGRGTDTRTVALLEQFIPNEGTAAAHARSELARYCERALTELREHEAPPYGRHAAGLFRFVDAPEEAAEPLGLVHSSATLLGHRIGELHLALASAPSDPAFSPETFSLFDQRSTYQSVRVLAARVVRRLRLALPSLAGPLRAEAESVVVNERAALARIEPLLSGRIEALRTRVHGKLTLGNVLFTGKDFVIVDFDGDPRKSIAERRRKRPPLADVARTLCSLHDVASASLLGDANGREEDLLRLAPWIGHWFASVCTTLLRSYLETTRPGRFCPRDRDQVILLLETFALATFLEELEEALERRRPLRVALAGLRRLLGLGDPLLER